MLRKSSLLVAVVTIITLVGSEALAKDQDTNPADYPLVAELLYAGSPTSTSTRVVDDTGSETSRSTVVFKTREECKVGKIIYTTVVMDRGHWFDETVGDTFPARFTTPRNHVNSIEILSVE